MKVLYYVEKELAQFDPARRLRGRCEHLSCAVMQESIANGDWGGVTEPGQLSSLGVRTSRGAEGTVPREGAPSVQEGGTRATGVKNGASVAHGVHVGVSVGQSAWLARCTGVGSVVLNLSPLHLLEHIVGVMIPMWKLRVQLFQHGSPGIEHSRPLAVWRPQERGGTVLNASVPLRGGQQRWPAPGGDACQGVSALLSL